MPTKWTRKVQIIGFCFDGECLEELEYGRLSMGHEVVEGERGLSAWTAQITLRPSQFDFGYRAWDKGEAEMQFCETNNQWWAGTGFAEFQGDCLRIKASGPISKIVKA